jgi:hypothetical protein
LAVRAEYEQLLAEIREEFPGFRVVRKADAWTQRAIDRLLRVVTFGAQTSYLDSYQTTIRRTVYVTDDWERTSFAQRYITMRHEREHLRQFRRYTTPLMALLYVFGPLPVGLAWFRAHFEKQGYAESMRATAEVHGLAHVESAEYRAYVIRQFTSGAYGWMWPFPKAMNRWYDAVVTDLRRRHAHVKEPRLA